MIAHILHIIFLFRLKNKSYGLKSLNIIAILLFFKLTQVGSSELWQIDLNFNVRLLDSLEL